MNPEWNTPPNGDFATYVERLSARSAGVLRGNPAPAQAVLDEGMHSAAPLPPSQPQVNEVGAVQRAPQGGLLSTLGRLLVQRLEEANRQARERAGGGRAPFVQRHK